jgi:hypothetical protein
MKKQFFVATCFILISLLFGGCSPSKENQNSQMTPTLPAVESATNLSPTKDSLIITVVPRGDMVKVPLIAVDDNGASGMKIGCGDSVIMVDRPLSSPDALVQAYSELLAIRTRDYGESGLVDPLYQSTLTIKNIYVQDGIAYIHLEGEFMMGGECDIPRVQAQLEQTALQFPEVTAVQVFINEKTLAEALSLK